MAEAPGSGGSQPTPRAGPARTGPARAVPGRAGPGRARPGLLLAWAALVVVYVIWGSTYLAIRVGVRDIPPAMLAGVRYLIAGAILFPVASRTGARPARPGDGPPRAAEGEAPPTAGSAPAVAAPPGEASAQAAAPATVRPGPAPAAAPPTVTVTAGPAPAGAAAPAAPDPARAAGPPAPAAATADPAARPGWREWLGCGVVGLLLLAGGNGVVTLAEKSLASGLAAVLVATVPLWMVVFAWPLERQRVTWRAAAGLAAGLIGVAVLVGGGSAGGHLAGVLLVLAAAASWGFGSVLGRRLRLPRQALLAAAMEMLVGGAVLLIIALATGEAGRTHWGQIAPTAWLALAWLILPGSILAFTAYGYALAHLPLATVSTYAYVNPVVAVLLGVGLLHERLAGREVLGTLLVVASVAVTLYRPAPRPSPPGPSAPPGPPDRVGPAERTKEPESVPADRPSRLHDL
jgi:drug/metabolite transporter (DMT)-like permease